MSRMIRPPYVDPTTNIIFDTDNPDFQGWLTKQSMWLRVRTVVDVADLLAAQLTAFSTIIHSYTLLNRTGAAVTFYSRAVNCSFARRIIRHPTA